MPTRSHVLDCLLSMAKTAQENRYIRPEVNETEVIDIHQGRHPVIEKQLPPGEAYVANDVKLDSEKKPDYHHHRSQHGR